MLATAIYGLCAVAALLCAVLLLRAYGKGGYRLLLWSGLCFTGLTINNIILMLDKIVLPDYDLSLPRSIASLFAMMILMYGLIFDQR